MSTPSTVDSVQPWIVGEVKVQLFHGDGRLDREIDLGRNVVALDWTLLISSWVKDTNTPNITHLAVGTGTPSYNIASPPLLTAQKKLVAELFRKRIQYNSFVDEDGDPTQIETNVVDLTAKFEFLEAVGTLQEMGLFGGYGATDRNSGHIVNYKGFVPFVKPNDRVMVITWRLRFEF